MPRCGDGGQTSAPPDAQADDVSDYATFLALTLAAVLVIFAAQRVRIRTPAPRTARGIASTGLGE